MKTLAIHKLGNNKGAPRVYLEGAQLKRAKFDQGKRFEVNVSVENSMVAIRLADSGSRVVSKKQTGGQEIPVIDINSHQALSIFEGLASVRVIIKDSEIFILPLSTEVKKRRREQSLKQAIESKVVTVGSLSHGGGVLSHAIHEGLAKSGLKSKLAFANDIRPELLDQAFVHNDAWDEDTMYLGLPLQELAYDTYAMARLPEVNIAELGLPCTGASLSGRAKNHLSMAEAHPDVGHLIAPALAVIARANPACIVFENVTQYANTASMHILRWQLRDMGYVVHETVLEGEDFNCIEHRSRLCMVAVTEGVDFDFESLVKPLKVSRQLSEIMEDVPDNDTNWSPMTYLKDKEIRDKAAGKGFAMNIVTEKSAYVGTIGKGYSKRRSTEPMIRNKSNPDLLRLLTIKEHAAVKGIPEKLVIGMGMTIGHELLGQSIVYDPFVEVGRAVGESLKQFSKTPTVNESIIKFQIEPQLDLLAAA
ncbi:MAG: DNA cytosine methyltransferase [Methylotenera sp.]|nr:MAG: DNA cytosine methyltransferase [Methylotenera sp.]